MACVRGRRSKERIEPVPTHRRPGEEVDDQSAIGAILERPLFVNSARPNLRIATVPLLPPRLLHVSAFQWNGV